MTSFPLTLFLSGLLGLMIIGAILGGIWLRWTVRRRIIATLKRYPFATWKSLSANLFGVQSQGMRQIRGNGTLILADGLLVFEIWLPQREVIIPLSQITTLNTLNSFLGKTRGTPLLHVTYQTDSGQADAATWQVDNINEAVKVIRTAVADAEPIHPHQK